MVWAKNVLSPAYTSASVGQTWGRTAARWALRRLWYCAALAAWAGMVMAMLVVTAHHEGGVPTEIVCTVTACTPGE